MVKLLNINMEIEKQKVATELGIECVFKKSNGLESEGLRHSKDIKRELRQLLIDTQIQRLKYIQGVQDDIISPIIIKDSDLADNEKTIMV